MTFPVWKVRLGDRHMDTRKWRKRCGSLVQAREMVVRMQAREMVRMVLTKAGGSRYCDTVIVRARAYSWPQAFQVALLIGAGEAH